MRGDDELRILFLARRYPYPLTAGGHMRTYGFVRALAQRATVTLVCFGTGPPLDLEGVRVLSVGRRPGSRRALGRDGVHIALANLRAPDPRLPLQVRLSLDRRMRRIVRGELETFKPHVVHAMPSTMAAQLPPPGTCHRHLDFNDSLALSMMTQASVAPLPFRPLMRLEAALLRRYEARAALAVESCSISAERDRRFTPELMRARVLPPGIDLDGFAYREPSRRMARLIFFGNLGYTPNVVAAEFVAKEVLPLIRAEVRDAELMLVGAGAGPAVQGLGELEGVRLVGRVEDMSASISGAAVALLPSLSGAGIKTKVQEAFASGTPVVSNRLGVEGIDAAVEGRHYLGGETAAGLAQASVRLLRQPATRVEIAAAARALIEGFSWEAQAQVLLDAYGDAHTRGSALLSRFGGRMVVR